MSISVVGQVGAGTAESVASLTVDVTTATTAGDTIFATVKLSFGATVTSVTDTQSNTWDIDIQSGGSASTSIICRATNAKALSTSDTVTVNTSASQNMSVQLVEVSGLASTPLDQTAKAVDSGSSTVSATTASTTSATELALTTAGNGYIGASTWTPPSGWTQIASGISNPNFIDTAYLLLTTEEAVSATWGNSEGAATNLSMVTATYKGSSIASVSLVGATANPPNTYWSANAAGTYWSANAPGA